MAAPASEPQETTHDDRSLEKSNSPPNTSALMAMTDSVSGFKEANQLTASTDSSISLHSSTSLLSAEVVSGEEGEDQPSFHISFNLPHALSVPNALRLHPPDDDAQRIRSAYLSRVGIRSSLPSFVDLSPIGDPLEVEHGQENASRPLALSGPSSSPNPMELGSASSASMNEGRESRPSSGLLSRRRSHSSAIENYLTVPQPANPEPQPPIMTVNYNSLAPELVGSDGYLTGSTSVELPVIDSMAAKFEQTLEREKENLAARDRIFDQTLGPLQTILERRMDIDYSAIIFGRRLGQGAFGEVCHAQLWGIDVAVKRLKCDRYNFPLQEITSELAMLKALRHPNCVLFLGFVRNPHFCIITEYMARGSLYDIIHNPQVRLNNQLVKKVAESVALAMSYLHSQQPAIVHKDLKSHNILVDDNWTIKVGDYGLSSLMDSIQRHQYWAGTAQWRAPEVTENSYGLAADVYSYGVVLWEMITRKRPFEGLPAVQALRLVKENNARPSIPQHCPPFFRELMEACWHADPNSRPSFPKIVEMLKQYESEGFTQNQTEVFRETDVNSSLAFFKAKQNTVATILPEGVLHARVWSGVFHFGMKKTGLYMLNKEVLPLVQDVAAGSFVFVDDFGRGMALFIYDSFEKLREADEIALENSHLALELNQMTCTPLIRESLELVPFHLSLRDPKKGMVCLVITVAMSESALQEAKTLYSTYVIPELQRIKFWRGSLLLTDGGHSKFKLINFFDSKEELSRLEADGFVHQQLANFSTFVTDHPLIEHYDVAEFHYTQLAEEQPGVECELCESGYTVEPPTSKTSFSLAASAPTVLAEEDKEWELVMEVARAEEKKEARDGFPTGTPTGYGSMHASSPTYPESSFATLSSSTPSIASSSSSAPAKEPLWAQVRKLGAFINNGRSLNEHELEAFQQKFGLPPGEWVIKVFICHYTKTGPGQLYITPNYVCFSAMLSFEKNQLVIPIRDITSLNKTKYSLLPGTGHAVELMTRDRTVHVFQGIFKRDQLVATIVEQGKTMKPHRHLILVLFQGVPEDLNKPFTTQTNRNRGQHTHASPATTTTTSRLGSQASQSPNSRVNARASGGRSSSNSKSGPKDRANPTSPKGRRKKK